MYRSRLLQAPVITLLSPSLAASQNAVKLLSAVGNMQPVFFDRRGHTLGATGSSQDNNTNNDDHDDGMDDLDAAFASSMPGFSCSWNSMAAFCPVSRSVIHFCSMGRRTTSNTTSRDANSIQKNCNTPFALLAITESSIYSMAGEKENVTENQRAMIHDSIQHCRNLLASHVQSSSSTGNLFLNLKHMVNPLVPLDLLKHSVSSDGLPLLSINQVKKKQGFNDTKETDRETSSSSTFLKEIAVPFFDYAEYKDGSTLLSMLSRAETERPAVGVYQWPDSLTCIRPLPTAAEDRRLPSPSFIFHSESPEEDAIIIEQDYGVRKARIGYGGQGDGQIMLRHDYLMGLDVRYCYRTAVSSAFSEAQEALLAGSLQELQSANILLAGGEKAKDDERIGKGDCWVEVRANLKRPSGYWNRKSSKTNPKSSQKIAKIPDLPFE